MCSWGASGFERWGSLSAQGNRGCGVNIYCGFVSAADAVDDTLSCLVPLLVGVGREVLSGAECIWGQAGVGDTLGGIGGYGGHTASTTAMCLQLWHFVAAKHRVPGVTVCLCRQQQRD